MSSPSTLSSIANNLFTTIEDIMSSFVTSLSNYSGVIADLLIGGLVAYATVRFGGRVLRALSRWINDVIPF